MSKKNDELLMKLAKRKGITDPKGLAAWIKKHKKEDEDMSLFDKLVAEDKTKPSTTPGRPSKFRRKLLRNKAAPRFPTRKADGEPGSSREKPKVRAPNVSGRHSTPRNERPGLGPKRTKAGMKLALRKSAAGNKASNYREDESLFDKLVAEGLLDESPIFTVAATSARRASQRPRPRPRPQPKKQKQGDKKSLWGRVKGMFGSQEEETITKGGDPRKAVQQQALKLMKQDARLRKMAPKK